MTKKDFARKAADILRQNGARKTVAIPKQVFHLSDDNGNHKDFTVRAQDENVVYTVSDVEKILDALLCATKEALKVGDPIYISGFGSMGLKYRKPRQTREMGTGEIIDVAGRFVPKFTFGNDLRVCARIYEMSLNDRMNVPEAMPDDYWDDDEDGDVDGAGN